MYCICFLFQFYHHVERGLAISSTKLRERFFATADIFAEFYSKHYELVPKLVHESRFGMVLEQSTLTSFWIVTTMYWVTITRLVIEIVQRIVNEIVPNKFQN